MGKVVKVFISQPMKGKEQELIKEEREAAIAAAREVYSEGGKNQVEVLDSYHPEWAEELKEDADKRVFFLGKSISLLSEADVVVFCKSWPLFSGCRMEEAVAREYEKTRFFL